MLGEAHPLCGAASGHPTFPAFARDLAAGAGDVAMSEALARKYPSAAAEWGWPWVFRRAAGTWRSGRVSCTGTTWTLQSC